MALSLTLSITLIIKLCIALEPTRMSSVRFAIKYGVRTAYSHGRSISVKCRGQNQSLQNALTFKPVDLGEGWVNGMSMPYLLQWNSIIIGLFIHIRV